MRGFNVVKSEFRQHEGDIILPTRADPRSAGYDIYLPKNVTLLPGQKTLVFTDIKAYMMDDEVLNIHIRSSLGVKQGIILSNITGIIDSSYYENEGNDGNIGLALLNTSGRGVSLFKGERIAQGIFTKFLTVDTTENFESVERTGGFGSSGK